MSNILTAVSDFAALYPHFIYLIIFFGSFIQGETTILFSVFLVQEGRIPWPSYISLMFTGVILNEIAIYYVAGWLRRTRFGQRFHEKIPYHDGIEKYLRKNSFQVIMLSKVILGASFIVIFLSGWVKTRFKYFLRHILIAAFFWLATFSVLAHVLISQLSYLKSSHTFRQIEIIIGIVVVFVILVKYLSRRFFRKKLLHEEESDEVHTS